MESFLRIIIPLVESRGNHHLECCLLIFVTKSRDSWTRGNLADGMRAKYLTPQESRDVDFSFSSSGENEDILEDEDHRHRDGREDGRDEGQFWYGKREMTYSSDGPKMSTTGEEVHKKLSRGNMVGNLKSSVDERPVTVLWAPDWFIEKAWFQSEEEKVFEKNFFFFQNFFSNLILIIPKWVLIHESFPASFFFLPLRLLLFFVHLLLFSPPNSITYQKIGPKKNR